MAEDKDKNGIGSLGDIFGDDFFDTLTQEAEKSEKEPEAIKIAKQENPKIPTRNTLPSDVGGEKQEPPKPPSEKPPLSEEEQRGKDLKGLSKKRQIIIDDIANKKVVLANKTSQLEELDSSFAKDNADSFNVAKRKQKLRKESENLESDISRKENELYGISKKIDEIERLKEKTEPKAPRADIPEPEPEEDPIENESEKEPEIKPHEDESDIKGEEEPAVTEIKIEKLEKEKRFLQKNIESLEYAKNQILRDISREKDPSRLSKLEANLKRIQKDVDRNKNSIAVIEAEVKNIQDGEAKTETRESKSEKINREDILDEKVYGAGFFEYLNVVSGMIDDNLKSGKTESIEDSLAECEGAIEAFRGISERLDQEARGGFADLKKEIDKRKEATVRYIRQWEEKKILLEEALQKSKELEVIKKILIAVDEKAYGKKFDKKFDMLLEDVDRFMEEFESTKE